MNGRVFPEDPFFSSPWWINFFENPGLAQFDHRIGAYIVAGCRRSVIWYWRGAPSSPAGARQAPSWWLIITVVQIGLGIATLLLQAPEGSGGAAPGDGAALLCAAVWHAYELRAPSG